MVGGLQQCKIMGGGVLALHCEKWQGLGMSHPSQGCEFRQELEVCEEQGPEVGELRLLGCAGLRHG